jgi:hypothetical protein
MATYKQRVKISEISRRNGLTRYETQELLEKFDDENLTVRDENYINHIASELKKNRKLEDGIPGLSDIF